MNFDTGALVSIAIFLLLQTGTFLWWGGGITQAVKDVRARVDRNETDAYATALKQATLEGELRK